MDNNNPNHQEINKISFEYTLALVGGKWKLNILFWLARNQVMRYGELKRTLKGVSHKMLSNQLKDLEGDSLIVRREYPQVPPKVEYYLSERGLSLMPALKLLCNWGAEHVNDEL